MSTTSVLSHRSASFPMMQDSVNRTSLARDVFTLMAAWVTWLEVTGGANRETRRQYRRYLVAFIADTLWDLTTLTEDDLVQWAGTVEHRGAQYGQTLKALKSFYAFLLDREIIAKDPTRRLKIPKGRTPVPPMTPDDDMERFFGAAEKLDPRARPALELAFSTGARIASLAGALPEDVDLPHSKISWRVVKYDDVYTSVLGPRGMRCATALLDLIHYTPPTAPVRRSTLVGVGKSRISQWTHTASEESGVPMWTHRLRHEYAHRIANDPKVPAFVASKMLNHRDPRMIDRYALPMEDTMRAAVAGL